MPPDRLAAALLLAAIAGVVDAVGFTELNGYYVSFMSGNSTQLGVHLAYHDWNVGLFALGLVVLFVGGAALGSLIEERTGRMATAALMLVQAVLLAIASVLLDGARPMAGAVLLPVAMGMANLAIMNGRGGHIGITYLTGTLVRIGAGLASLGRGARFASVLSDIALWAALVGGVVFGGIGHLHYAGKVLLAPVFALTVLGIAEGVIARRAARRSAAASVPPTARR